ncbi:PREDICTED: uncharacterized protein LOC109587748 [Amphimedon queenslandica]|uniref:Uncharacterized protein n=1 Tax=Amphimedon queenslandica TaxID=400682 RepID=A0AAN0JRP5_AMPQE|nr:PREDICTED: uncharacterized protein LOC109587748 [Amphimedon queenslandica]|eukprot:XP_019859531.1 PREDICTED: uncharacterized protein LOC109587748 [Amphimedon queenslandica]
MSMTVEINGTHYKGPRTEPTVISTEVPTVGSCSTYTSKTITMTSPTSTPSGVFSDEFINISTLYVCPPLLGISLFINMIFVCVMIGMCCKKKKVAYNVNATGTIRPIKLKKDPVHNYAVIEPPVIQNPQEVVYDSPLELSSFELQPRIQPPPTHYRVMAEQENQQ